MIDFGADSCVPCKEMAPVLKKLNTEMQGKAIVKFVDVWKN
ncbi:Thioredoxin [Desulfosporosinus metallidurans]|uniref:Thioredoxin n=1 Tax=Desulfosporosinus metallidurans TaxID=1888891 RepID=A0A1Q8QZY2_9FIRM|nr:Thioredoxin [Desulfosporosinus metallidurans]